MSTFEPILRTLVERVPGAVGAVFTDWEGEPVDQFAHVAAIDIQIVGAQWGLVFLQANERLQRHGVGAVDELLVEGERATVLVRAVTDRYLVVLAVQPSAHLGKARLELMRGAEVLRGEM